MADRWLAAGGPGGPGDRDARRRAVIERRRAQTAVPPGATDHPGR
jgi:hypothetical protein